MLGKQVQTDLTTSLWSCLDDSGVSASEALYGAHLCLSGEFLDSDRVPPAVFLERVQSALRGWCCLLNITDLPLLLEFPLLWPLQTSHLFARILQSGLCLNFTQGPYKVLTLPAWMQFLLTPSNQFTALNLFLSSLHAKLDLHHPLLDLRDDAGGGSCSGSQCPSTDPSANSTQLIS